MRDRKGGKIVCFVGLIAAGKSTLSEQCADRPNTILFPEPRPSNNLITNYYKDPALYSYKIQKELLVKRAKIYAEAIKAKNNGLTVLIEQPMIADCVYGKANESNMSPENFKKYMISYNKQVEIHSDDLPNLIVYLKITVETSQRNIKIRAKQRGNNEEIDVKVAYLETLKECWENWIQTTAEKGCKDVIIKDWNTFPTKEDLELFIDDILK